MLIFNILGLFHNFDTQIYKKQAYINKTYSGNTTDKKK